MIIDELKVNVQMKQPCTKTKSIEMTSVNVSEQQQSSTSFMNVFRELRRHSSWTEVSSQTSNQNLVIRMDLSNNLMMKIKSFRMDLSNNLSTVCKQAYES